MTAAATHRTLRRAATVADIKAAAWADMAASGTDDVSLRGVARELGMAVSALYRYFASREELITALVVDAFDDLAARLHAAWDSAPPDEDPVSSFVRVGSAYRRWALDEPLRYRLAFGNPLQGYTGTAETTAASERSSAVLLEVMARAVAADLVDLEKIETLLTPQLSAALDTWARDLTEPLPTAALGGCMICYSALHGAIDLEVKGHVPPALQGNDDLFEAVLRTTLQNLLR